MCVCVDRERERESLNWDIKNKRVHNPNFVGQVGLDLTWFELDRILDQANFLSLNLT